MFKGSFTALITPFKNGAIDEPALKRFVDLQTRYSSVLGSHIPAVQKADLSSRNLGIQYRAVVGPPGSRKAALKVCSQLRAAGYQGCWVKAY